MKKSSLKNMFTITLIGILLIGAFLFFRNSTSNSVTSSSQKKETHLDVLKAKIDSFTILHQEELLTATKKIEKITTLLNHLDEKPLNTTQKLKLGSITCGGSSDLCRFDPENLALVLLKTDLIPDSNAYKGTGYLGSHDVLNLYRMNKSISNGTYKPQGISFQDYSFPSVLKELENDLYNVQAIWKARWYLILEVNEVEKTTSKYGDGIIEGKWHLFDFNEVTYLGSIPINITVAEDFNPSLVSTSSKTISRTTWIKYPGGTYVPKIDRTTKETSTYASEEDQVRQAIHDLHKDFERACEQALKDNFLNEKGEKIAYFY